MKNKGYEIVNIDTTIKIQKPKMRPYIDKIRENLAKVIKIPASDISVKAKTMENMGIVGIGDADISLTPQFQRPADDLFRGDPYRADRPAGNVVILAPGTAHIAAPASEGKDTAARMKAGQRFLFDGVQRNRSKSSVVSSN